MHDGRVTVLDFAMANIDIVCHDVAHLYLDIGGIAAKPGCRPSVVVLQREPSEVAGFDRRDWAA